MKSCFSKKNFECLTETEKIEYLKNNFFFCSGCHCIFNMCLIKIKEKYNENTNYYSINECKIHNHKKYPKHYL